MSENITQIKSDNFETEVLQAGVPVLVDFWAPWCGPCKAIAPILEDLAVELGSSVKIAKVNIDDNQALASNFAIRSIPTLLLFQNGKVVNKIVGLASKEDIKAQLSA